MYLKHVMTLIVLAAVMLPSAFVYAGGMVSVCDEAHLRAALTGGGTVTFSCSGTIVLASQVRIANNTTIDGAG